MKQLKPLSSKKPPTPVISHDVVADWIASVRPDLKPIATSLDKAIRKQLKEHRFAVKWGKAYYGSPDLGWCVELVAYNVSVNIVFLNGNQLEDPPKLGGETRYEKVRTVAEASSPRVLRWIEQCCQRPGWDWHQ